MTKILKLFLLLAALGSLPAWAQQSFDLLVVNGMINDGSGAESRRADVGIRSGKIAAVANAAQFGEGLKRAADIVERRQQRLLRSASTMGQAVRRSRGSAEHGACQRLRCCCTD